MIRMNEILSRETETMEILNQKSIKSEIKNSLDGFNSRMEVTEETVHEPKVKSVDICNLKNVRLRKENE